MITNELQDLAGSVLPKEFKEEVKKEWQTANNEERLTHDAFLRGCYSTITLLFGIHNLTSDAEGEEILTCEKSIAQHMVKSAIRSIQIHDFEGNTIASQNMATFNRGIKFALDQLFGSKCLPDEVGENLSEPEEQSRNLSQNIANCDKCPKFVQKTHPDFGHSRLTIAAMAMQGMLSNTTRFSSYEISDLVRISLNCADALIKKAEKGGDE